MILLLNKKRLSTDETKENSIKKFCSRQQSAIAEERENLILDVTIVRTQIILCRRAVIVENPIIEDLENDFDIELGVNE